MRHFQLHALMIATVTVACLAPGSAAQDVPAVDGLIAKLAKIPGLGGNCCCNGQKDVDSRTEAFRGFNSSNTALELGREVFALDENSASELVKQAWQSQDEKVRTGFARVLAEPLFDKNPDTLVTPPPDIAAFLNRADVVNAQIQFLEDDNPNVRRWSALGLGLSHLQSNADPAIQNIRADALIAGIRSNNLDVGNLCAHVLIAGANDGGWKPATNRDKVALCMAAGQFDEIAKLGRDVVPVLWAEATARPGFLAGQDVDDMNYRMRVVLALIAIGGPESKGHLIELLPDADAHSAMKICIELCKSPDSHAVSVLKDATTSTSVCKRRYALFALGASKDESAFNIIAPFVDSAVQSDREASVRSLGELGDRRAVDVLISLIDEETDYGVKVGLYRSLGKLADTKSISALARAANKGQPGPEFIGPISPTMELNREAANAAAQALRAIGTPDALKALREARPDLQKDVKSESIPSD